jgi:AmmeMemoRadiSam system protein B
VKIREAAVAGAFYEADPGRLKQVLASLLAAPAAVTGDRPAALIVPHAGYIYSGAMAARAYRTLAPFAHEISRVVLFGPAHRVPLRGMALPDVEAFATPLGTVPLDRAVMRFAAGLPGVCISGEAHRLEHSLEVQLPFLQAVLGAFSLVPVVVGRCDAATVAAAMDALWGGAETLVVVSTDLSHFHDYDEATRLDARTCSRVVAKDAALDGHDACGACALNGLLSSHHGRALTVEQLGMCNSGDTAGSRDRVVGYGAFVLH